MKPSFLPPDPDTDPAAETEAADGLIHVMPETLANKIAAGEVVQRPASVAKELIENSLDAGARQIALVIAKAGSEVVQVVDDGGGMGPQDALACFGRHATSKLRQIEDLEHLLTLGFRGEALASIAAVAQVELKTRRVQDDAGFRVRIDGGRLVEHGPCATPAGTNLAVRNLFFNVPARRNFLKSPATEFRHLVETFQHLALSNPTVGFTLTNEGGDVYRLTAPDRDPDAALAHRIGDLLGDEYRDTLVAVREETSYLAVTGFVGRPGLAKKGRSEQFLFVNGRTVKHRGLAHAVASAYGELLPDAAYPFFALFLRVDPRHVDVNVHPTKTEVQFDDERAIYSFLKAVVRKSLGEVHLVPRLNDLDAPMRPLEAGPGGVFGASLGAASWMGTASAPGRRWEVGTASPSPASFSTSHPLLDGRAAAQMLYSLRPAAPEVEPAPTPIPSRSPEQGTLDLPDAEPTNPPVWRLHGRYVLTPIRTGLLIVDQQAAHRRILYERALALLDTGLAASQQLLFPQTVEFSVADFELVKELLPDLRAVGFDLKLASGRTVFVNGVPDDVRVGAEKTILEDLLAQYKDDTAQGRRTPREALARGLALRSAYPVGQDLSEVQARLLIDQLFACRMPFVDPDGRPTTVRYTHDDLARRFAEG